MTYIGSGVYEIELNGQTVEITAEKIQELSEELRNEKVSKSPCFEELN